MRIYEVKVGESITTTAARMVALANETGGEIQATFNGVELHAQRGSSPLTIIESYQILSRRRSKAWKSSPEGRRVAAEGAKRVTILQNVYNQAMVDLNTLNWTNLSEVIAWLDSIQDATDTIGVVRNPKAIVKVFRVHGYEPGVNCYKDFDAEDRENVARWLIGQALDNLMKVGAIHQIFHKLAEDWHEKFGE